MAGRWEPCKPRGFRTVLRAAGGEIPPADSPGRDVLVPQPGRAALERLTDLLAGLGLEPKAAKTRIVHLEEGGEGFDFLGFHHRLVRSRGLNGKRPVTVPGPLALRTRPCSMPVTGSGT